MFGTLGCMNSKTSGYQCHRFSTEIMRHAMWPYHRFCLRFWEKEEPLVKRCFIASYETVHQWCQNFCPAYTGRIKKRQNHSGDTWQRDNMYFPSRATALFAASRGPGREEDCYACATPTHANTDCLLSPSGQPGLSGLEGIGVCKRGERKPVSMCSHQVK